MGFYLSFLKNGGANRVSRRTELYSYMIKNQEEVVKNCENLRNII